jgi:hypothetical protein
VAGQPFLQPRKRRDGGTLDAVLELRGYVEEFQAAELPRLRTGLTALTGGATTRAPEEQMPLPAVHIRL